MLWAGSNGPVWTPALSPVPLSLPIGFPYVQMGTVHVAQASEENDVIQTRVHILELLAAWVKFRV